MKFALKTLLVVTVLSLILVANAVAAQTPPVIGATSEDVKTIAKGWSIKKTILGKDVYNDANVKLGVVEDIVVTPDKALSYAIIGAGGFLGLAKYDVLIPVSQFTMKDKRIILTGATKESLKLLPEFKYAE